MRQRCATAFCLTVLCLSVCLSPGGSLAAQGSWHSLSLGAGTAIPDSGMEASLEYALHWRPLPYFGVSPFLRLNLGAIDSLEAWGRHFSNANDWAGENTLAFNILLVGLPYFFAGTIAALETQILFCPGLELSGHLPFARFFDLSLAAGVENNPYRVHQEDAEVLPIFFYPVLTAKTRVSFAWKAFMASLWADYEYELFYEIHEVEPHGFHWGADLGWRFGMR